MRSAGRRAKHLDFDEGMHLVYEAGRALTGLEERLWEDVLRSAIADRALTIRRSLDVGCGTGRLAPVIERATGAAVIGVDPARRMLAEGRASHRARGVAYCSGSAEDLPVASSSCQLALLFLSLHHFSSIPDACLELRRVIEPGGIVVIRTQFRDRDHDVRWHELIPEAAEIDKALYPPFETTIQSLEDAGFDDVQHSMVRYVAAPAGSVYVDRLRSCGMTVLQLYGRENTSRALDAADVSALSEQTSPIYEVGHLLVCQ